jgi:hypothetical protein
MLFRSARHCTRQVQRSNDQFGERLAFFSFTKRSTSPAAGAIVQSVVAGKRKVKSTMMQWICLNDATLAQGT